MSPAPVRPARPGRAARWPSRWPHEALEAAISLLGQSDQHRYGPQDIERGNQHSGREQRSRNVPPGISNLFPQHGSTLQPTEGKRDGGPEDDVLELGAWQHRPGGKLVAEPNRKGQKPESHQQDPGTHSPTAPRLCSHLPMDRPRTLSPAAIPSAMREKAMKYRGLAARRAMRAAHEKRRRRR